MPSPATDTGARNLAPAKARAASIGPSSSPSAPDREGLAVLLEAAHALERGDIDLTVTLLETTDRRWTATRLLRARVRLRQGDTVEALREIEAARQVAPTDGRVYAVSAELYCALDRLQAAEEEIRTGLALCGETPELERARGVHLLAIPGGASKAARHLTRALELDPTLPFCAGALAQAYLLSARAHLRDGKPLEAVKSVRLGLEVAPDDFDLRQLHGDALLAVGSLRHAVDVFEDLHAEGHPVEHDLAMATWRAGMGELLRARRPDAIALFARARELGMSDEALGAAADILRDEALRLTGRGVEAYDDGRVEAARDLFAEALYLDPENVTAENHLAVAYYRLGLYGLAIDGWERVLAGFAEEGASPPEPVQLNVARAWLALDRPEDAWRAVHRWNREGAEPAWRAEADDILRRVEERLASDLPRAVGEGR
jgi:tetratricopeptide (TPR) repeat protein